ncbi:class I adenylate-forming enzyme family protein [Kordiimonas sp. SCSIO 12610]|uniref:class I adenylate-forming enzyme family protein n=1 Tax=Kordiimonas sp. SCSIO 12610 TaxID=2829597 RepID=UPI0021089083|nr:class I adenylate-forming enzyme family protein [Kordiimonas sp. SCSIO 12610]UTW56773.1 acyl--CoA ligase [Kordiimonas sp. SCSIO 12610]
MLDELELPQLPPETPIHDAMEMLCKDGMPFATHETEIHGITQRVFTNQPATLREVLMLILGHGDKEFIVYEDERYTFKDAIDKAARFAQALVNDCGVKKGDCVALAMRNYPEWPIAYMGIVASGARAVLMNAWWKTEELKWAMEDCGAKLLVADAQRAGYLQDHLDELDLHVIIARDSFEANDRIKSFDSLLDGKTPLTFPDVDIANDDDAMMLYTSGSTGFPKGAVSSHRAVISVLFNWVVIALALKMVGRANPDPDFQPIMLVAVPFFHVTGLVPVMLVSAVIGRKIVIMHKWDVERAYQLIEGEGVTSFTGVPTMSYELAASPLRENYDLSSLVDIGGGGAARPPEHVKMIRDVFKDSSPGIGYGLTETNSLTSVLSGPEYIDRPNSVGKAVHPIVDVKIMSADGIEEPTFSRGEICIKSAVNFRGYWNNDEATDEAFYPDGWFRSGDVGYLDGEGYLFIVDRMKEIIIRGGENISSQEVEGVLHAHPSVDDIMVFSLPDEHLGEIVGTVIVTNDDAMNDELIRSYAREHLANYKIPQKIWFTEAPLPLIASGKIDRKGIKQYYQNLYAGS